MTMTGRWKYGNKSLTQVAAEVAIQTSDPKAADVLVRLVRQVEEYRAMNQSLADSLQQARSASHRCDPTPSS